MSMNPGATTLPAASIVARRRRVDARRDPDDRVAAHGDVAAIPRAARAVDDAAVANDEIEGRRLRARRGDEQRER